MIGYHYSPTRNRESIAKHGLLVPKLHPKLIQPVVCSEGHRNPHISLGKTPFNAWELSGGFLYLRAMQQNLPLPQDKEWDLWQVNLLSNRYINNAAELQVRTDIKRKYVKYIGSRLVHSA